MTYLALVRLVEKGLGKSPLGLNPPSVEEALLGIISSGDRNRCQTYKVNMANKALQIRLRQVFYGVHCCDVHQLNLQQCSNPLLELAGFSQSSPDGEKARCVQLSMVHAIEWKDRLRKLSKAILSLTRPSKRYQCVGNLSQLSRSSGAIQ